MEKFFNLEKMGLSTVFKSLHIQIDKAVTIFGFFYLIAAKANLAETFFYDDWLHIPQKNISGWKIEKSLFINRRKMGVGQTQ